MSNYIPPTPNDYFPKNWNQKPIVIVFFAIGVLFLITAAVDLFYSLKERTPVYSSIQVVFMSIFTFFMGFVLKFLDDLVHLKRRQEIRDAEDYGTATDLEE